MYRAHALLLACLLLAALTRTVTAAPIGVDGVRLCHDEDKKAHDGIASLGSDSSAASGSILQLQAEPATLPEAIPLVRRAVVNIKAAGTSHSSSSTTTAPSAQTAKPAVNPKDKFGHWPTGVKIVPVWTLNGTTIYGVKPTHPGRPTDWHPTGMPAAR
ncbi:hypothetical protein JCM10908_005832 [Rhodotorula pacifica]|uniref:uncharacterized protein n=1 Tax=Rhodotorula pacifica TaxID=1495444 RepID=UPI0031808D14